MKYLTIVFLFSALACKLPASNEPAPEPRGENLSSLTAPQPKTFRVTLTGAGVQFTLSLFADLNTPDEEQLVITPTVIPGNGSISYEVTGFKFENSGLSRMGGANVASGGSWLVATLYENDIAVEVHSLSTAGTYFAFQNR